MKIALGIEYCGRDYYGWQRQNISPTIQESVETALSSIADEKVEVVCAGRTDAGVHAIQQVIHFETSSEREAHAWVLGANSKLPKDIAISWAKKISDDFHARFSAQSRTYQYVILNSRARPGILSGLVTWECRRLDLDKMKKASRTLLGEHDFTSFRAVACQAKTAIRNIQELDIRQMDDWFVITITANAFLHHMVRNIAGVLMTIGQGKEEVTWIDEVLAAKDRTAGGATAPPDGLYLVNVHYPEQYAIPNPKKLIEQFRFI